jgi:hypothetical protein
MSCIKNKRMFNACKNVKYRKKCGQIKIVLRKNFNKPFYLFLDSEN